MNRRYPELEVRGNYRQMGRQQGEAAREQIRAYAAINLERISKSVPVSHGEAVAIGRACLPYVERYSPHLLEELRGMEEGAGVSLDDLMLMQTRNQMHTAGDAGCTSFAMAAGANRSGHALVGQNWDNDPALDPFTIVLTRRPTDAPATMTLTQAGLIAYMGLNDRGIGICMNTLPAPGRRAGVPHYFVLRCIFETNSIAAAAAAVRRAERVIPNNLILATPEGPANFEITIDDLHILRDDRRLVHTNHCLHQDLRPINDLYPELIQSRPRKARIERAFAEEDRAVSLESIKRAFRDHEDYPRSICRHANDHPTNGYWVSVFSVIIEADSGRMHVSRGNPCTAPYETYQLN